jgi:predicted MFS family arabinose efflux permease
VGSIGALLMKVFGGKILAAFGFRRVLIVNAILAVGSIAALGLLNPAIPYLAMAIVILLGGSFRSLQFTCMHALSYSDVETRQAGAATAISSVAQQVSLSLGVAIGALVLELSQSMHGHATPQSSDFSIALYVVSAIAALSIYKMVLLPADAGHALIDGDTPKKQPPETEG